MKETLLDTIQHDFRMEMRNRIRIELPELLKHKAATFLRRKDVDFQLKLIHLVHGIEHPGLCLIGDMQATDLLETSA